MSIITITEEYKIIKQLGKGGFGEVYLVSNQKDNKYYAIKKILINNLSEEELKLRETEGIILSNISNEYIVKYYDSFKDNDYLYILMEYCETDLKKFINEHKDKKEFIDEKIIHNIVLELCLGIKEIHKHNLIHRDLKPENIFIKDNKIKIGDFGISKQLKMNVKYAFSVVGTNFYMAPEIIKGEKYNNKIDIWAFGCIIYELLTFKICFKSESLLGLVNKILDGKHDTIDINKYNKKWEYLIDLLLKNNYKERPDIDEVYNYLNNNIEKEIILKIDSYDYNKEIIKIGKENQSNKKLIKISKEKYFELKYERTKFYDMTSKKFIFYKFFSKINSFIIRSIFCRWKNKLN